MLIDLLITIVCIFALIGLREKHKKDPVIQINNEQVSPLRKKLAWLLGVAAIIGVPLLTGKVKGTAFVTGGIILLVICALYIHFSFNFTQKWMQEKILPLIKKWKENLRKNSRN